MDLVQKLNRYEAELQYLDKLHGQIAVLEDDYYQLAKFFFLLGDPINPFRRNLLFARMSELAELIRLKQLEYDTLANILKGAAA